MTGDRTVTVRWGEEHNRDPLARQGSTWTGPQAFYEGEPPPLNAWHDGLAVRLPYDVWQDLGGPIELTVTLSGGGS